MTVLPLTPRTAALHALREVSARAGRILVALLAPTPSRARHRALSPAEIRWQRWKSVLSDHIATALHVPLVAHPARPGPARAGGVPTAAWGPLRPDTRTAQSPAGAQRDDHRWPIEPPSPTGHAPPAAQPAQPVQWPEECPEARADSWTAPWTEPGTEPWAEPWVEPGVAWPAVAQFAVDGSDVVGPGVIAPGPVEPEVVEPAAFRPAADDLDAHRLDGHRHDDGYSGAEDTDVWEFQVGDLARWWDEAAARLDAAAREEARDRQW